MTSKRDKPDKAQANLDSDTPIASSTLNLDSIVLPKQQPRRYFDSEKLEKLTESVKQHGILENLLVRPLEGQENVYELVAGERRYRAALAAGLQFVPVTIRDLTPEEALEISLIENLQREDLNPMEETEAILQLLSSHLHLSSADIPSLLYQMDNQRKGRVTDNVMGNEQAKKVETIFTELGRMSWESFVSNRLPLLKLPDDILEVLRQGIIEYTKAKAIAKIKDSETRTALLEETIRENLSLSAIKERIKTLSSTSQPLSSPKTQIQTLSRSLNQTKLWEKDPKRWKKIEEWLSKIEALLFEVQAEEVTQEKPQSGESDTQTDDANLELEESITELTDEEDNPSSEQMSENLFSLLPPNQEDNAEEGLTDQQLADELGLNASTCYRWRTGKAQPRGANSNLFQEWEVRGNRWYRQEEKI